MSEEQMDTKKGGNALGIALVALGLFFLANEVFGFQLGRIFWPLWVILPGLAFFVGMAMGGKDTAPLAIPGSIIVMTGLVMFFQNLFDIWASWSYAWALVAPTGVGIGMLIGGSYSGNDGMVESGRKLVRIGLMLFAGFFLFFELLIGVSGFFQGSLGRWIVPAGFILLGLYVMFGRRGSKGASEGAEAEAR